MAHRYGHRERNQRGKRRSSVPASEGGSARNRPVKNAGSASTRSKRKVKDTALRNRGTSSPAGTQKRSPYASAAIDRQQKKNRKEAQKRADARRKRPIKDTALRNRGARNRRPAIELPETK